MTTIWKFPLVMPVNRQIVKLPRFSAILHVAEQHGELCLWAMVDIDPDKGETKTEDRTIIIRGTGHPIEEADRLEYIGTVLTMGGDLVWHVFEESA